VSSFQCLFRPNFVCFGVSQGARTYCDASGVLDEAMTFFPVPASSGSSQVQIAHGSKDGRGGADHDQPYSFGRRPREAAPFPFTTRQYGRLLALRGRIADGLIGADDVEEAGLARWTPSDDESPRQAPRLFGPCVVCGAVVAGAYYGRALRTCPKCAQDGGRDQSARAILHTAGVLTVSGNERESELEAQ
jgi:hypothetical protein